MCVGSKVELSSQPPHQAFSWCPGASMLLEGEQRFLYRLELPILLELSLRWAVGISLQGLPSCALAPSVGMVPPSKIVILSRGSFLPPPPGHLAMSGDIFFVATKKGGECY